ncbi:MAG: uroporphyrinogen-III C-methyltransferase [Burkholderiales bacterium]
MAGTVYLVGAGPGAADLLTLRAVRLLRSADIVFHDALVAEDVLEFAVQAERVAVGKRCGAHSAKQDDINRRLVDAARRHETVIRLKGGDPLLFGRAQEEIEVLLAAGVRVEVVPGVSAAFGASAELLQSLTARGVSRSVVFLTPRTGAGHAVTDWTRAAGAADTVVMYMAGRDSPEVVAALTLAGVPAMQPCVLVESATWPQQKVVPTRLKDLPKACLRLGDGPALLMMGEVYEARVTEAERAELSMPCLA